MKNCQQCKYCCLFDFGYSNYTTEGTEFFCAKKAHPAGHFDNWYGEDKRFEFVMDCPAFIAGAKIEMDVDHENISKLTPEQKEIYDYCVTVS